MLELKDFSVFDGKIHLTYLIPLLFWSSFIINSLHLLLLLHCKFWQNLLNSNAAKSLTADVLMNVQLPFPVTSQLDCCSVKFWEKEKIPAWTWLSTLDHILLNSRGPFTLFVQGNYTMSMQAQVLVFPPAVVSCLPNSVRQI